MEETLLPSKISDKNSWSVTEDRSSSRDGTNRWPDWDARESLKCKDSSEWPPWKCSQGNKDSRNGDTMDPEMLKIVDSSLNEQRGRGRGRLTNSGRDRGWNGISKRSSQISKNNSWHVTQDHSSSHNGHSHRRPDWAHKDDSVDREVHKLSDYLDSKIIDKNSLPVMEDHSSSRNGSHRLPDWDAQESLKCKGRSEWPSWECSQGNKDIQKGDTMDTEILTIADSSFDEQRGKGRLTESNGDRGRNGISKRPSQMSKNSWHVTKDNSSSLNSRSCRWPDRDAHNSSKCKYNSRWPPWGCFEGNKKTHKDDTFDREVHTVSDHTLDSKISDKNSSPVMEDHSSLCYVSHGWPDWNARESLTCKDSSEWPSWKCSQENKDIQKGITMDTKMLTIVDSSIDEQRGKGRLTESNRDRGWNGISKRPSEMSKINSWHVRNDHSSSHNGRSCIWPDWEVHNTSRCKDDSRWPSRECFEGNKDMHKDDTIDNEVHTLSDYNYNSKISDKNSCPVTEDHSSSHDGSHRWPDWDAHKSLKCKDSSEWPSWECSQGNKDIQKGDNMDTEMLTIAYSSLDELRGRGRFRESSRDREWNGISKRPSQRSKSNSWHVTKDHLSSRNDRSCRSPDRDACNSVKCKDESRWSSLECFEGNKDMHKDDIVDRKVHTLSDYTFDEHRSQHKIRKWGRSRSRSRQREHSKIRSRSPCNGLRQASYRLIEQGSVLEMTSRRCRDFAVGKCSRGCQCSFSDNYLRSRDRDHPRNELTERSKFRADDRGASQCDDYKGSAGRTCDKKPLEDKFPGVSERPKDTAGQGNWSAWPDRCIWNSDSHDSQSKKSDGRYKGNIDSQDLSEVEQIDNNILYNSVKKSGERNDSGSNEKLSERNECLPSHWHNSGNGAACTTKLINLNMSVDRETAMGQEKDKTKSRNGSMCNEDCSSDKLKAKLSGWGEKTKKSENGSTWDKFAGVSKRPKDTTSWDNWPVWPDNSTWNLNSHDPQSRMLDGMSKGNMYCQDLIDAKKQADNNILHDLVKKSSERDDPGRHEKLSEGVEFLQSDLCNGAAYNTNMDLKILVDKEKAIGQKKDMTKSVNSPTRGDEGCSLDRPKDTGTGGRTISNRDPRVFADVKNRNGVNVAHNFVQKDMTTSWKGQTWGDEGCSLHRPKASGRGGREIGNRDRVFADVARRNDGNISHSSVQKGIPNSGSGWSKKVTVRNANWLSSLQDDYNGTCTSTIKVSESVKLDDGKKPTNQGGDEKNSWNLICHDSACSLDNPKASGWGGSRFFSDRHCHDSVDVDSGKPSQNNLVNTYCEMAINGKDNKVVGKDEYLLSHMPNGRDGVDKGSNNLLASRKTFYRKENQIEAQGSEPGGFVFPPSSLRGFSQSCHALSTNPSNGFKVILDESGKYNLSALVNQMQNQFEEALKILEAWASSNSITTDQALRLSNLQAYLSENGRQNIPENTIGVHLKSNAVRKKLKMENLESPAIILKQQEPVYTEVNQKTVMVEKFHGNNSEGEQSKQGEEIIQSVGVDARCEAGESNQDEKSTRLFKNALVKLVKEILNPIWMEGQMKKEVHNAIVKKAVEKVISTEGVNIPKTQEHVEQYLSFSQPQISALINDYVAHFKRLEKTS